MIKAFMVSVAAVLALALHGCTEAPRSPNSTSAHHSLKPLANVAKASGNVRPPRDMLAEARDKIWKDYSLPEPLEPVEQYKAEFVHHLYGTADNYRWNRLDDKMSQIGISNLDGPYANFNGVYYPHPSRPFLWVKQADPNLWYKAGLLQEGENFVIRYYKQPRRDNVEALTRCWSIGSWNINRKTFKPNQVNIKELTWHCQSYNSFTMIPERGWQGEVGNKMNINNAGADRQVVDK